MNAKAPSLLLLCILLLPFCVYAQEEQFVIEQGRRYIDINIYSLDKLNKRISKQQDRLLNKLKKQEQRYASKLKRKDSAAYARYQQQPITYDSISKLNKNKVSSISRSNSRSTVDSLVSIKDFLQQKLPQVSGNDELSGYSDKLSQLKSAQRNNNYISELINQRTTNLRNINASAKGINSFKGIDKQVFYAKEKMKAFKAISEEPSKLEDEAMEILQGQQGFDQYMDKASGRSNNSNRSVADLEKAGYQTKRMMQEQLQQKFGSSLSGLQQNMRKQITDYQDKLKDFKTAVNTAKQSKQKLIQAKDIQKPSFKPNPMRSLPFSKRVEKQWNFQTNRSTIDGKPAMLQLSAMAGFKHTPKLTYGIGIATSIGLGKNWNKIKFSFEGVGLRTFAEWQFIYGIGAYTGYERIFKQATFIEKNEATSIEKQTVHNTNQYNESILLGLTKRYQISDKLHGSIQVLYDIWWKEKGLRTPIQLRITTLEYWMNNTPVKNQYPDTMWNCIIHSYNYYDTYADTPAYSLH